MRMSEVACAFSSFYESSTRYVLTELEVNPIVFDPFGRMIPLDGFASFKPKADVPPAAARAGTSGLEAFFNPTGIAVVGVSADDNGKHQSFHTVRHKGVHCRCIESEAVFNHKGAVEREGQA